MFLRTLVHRALCASALLSVLAVAANAQNLLTNPGFEAGGGGYSGYFTFGSGVQLSTPATDNIALGGVAAAKVYGGFNGCPGTPVFNVGGFGQAFPSPVVGREYTFSGFSFVSSTDPMLGTDVCARNRLIAKLVFFNAASGGAEIASEEIILGSGLSPVNQWIPFSISARVPPGALRVEALVLFLQPGCDPGSVFVDELSLTSEPGRTLPNVLANPGFASGLTGWSTFGNVFTDARAFTVRSAPGSAKLFSTFVVDAPSGMFQSVPAAPGSVWQLDVHARNTCQETPINGTNDNYALARIVFRDGANVEIGSNDVVIADNASPLGTYVLRSVQATAPTGTVNVEAYILFISPSLLGGAVWVDDISLRSLATADAPLERNSIELSAPRPNPTRAGALVQLSLVEAGDVNADVLDVSGRRVATIHRGALAAGSHRLVWDGRTGEGLAAAPGLYRVVVRTATEQMARSLVIAR